MRKVVGLDISLQKTAVCVLDHDGQIVWQGKVDSEPGPLIEKPGRRDRPVQHAPCERSLEWITRSEIGRPNPRIPSWGSSNARPRTEARSTNVAVKHGGMCLDL
jgi:hypothetical protein